MKLPFAASDDPSTTDPSTARTSPRRDLAIFWAGFLTTRLAILALLGLALRGREICDDLMYQGWLVADPWMILMGRGREIASYAPFEGFLMGSLMIPLRRVLPDFYAWRLAFLAWEGLAGTFFVLLLNRSVEAPRLRLRLIAAFLICPACWMASVVMPQDEVLIACFLTLSLWLVACGRYWAALLACGAGVIGVKIFLALPLVALVVLLPQGNLVTRGLVGFGLPAAVYGYQFATSWLRGTEAPLVNFAVIPTYGVNIWPWLFAHFPIPVKLAQRGSGILGLLLAVGLLAVPILRPGRLQGGPGAKALELSRLIAAMYLAFFAVFFQVNPEYYALFLPPLLLLLWSYRHLALVMAATALPWLTNWIYGIRAASILGTAETTGKKFFIDLYHRWVPLGLDTSYALCYWTGVVALILLSVEGIRVFLRGPSRLVESGAETPS